MTISLTGFMGCGKSSVGKVLSELLGCRFADLDDVIVEREGRSIPEIFAEDGEEEFRRMEKEALEGVLRGCEERIPGQSLNILVKSGTRQCAPLAPSIFAKEVRMVLALGGGAVMNPECERMVHEGTFCVYLRASAETLVERLTGEDSGRPLLAADNLRSRILDLMSRRATTYERTAHLIIDTDGKTIEEVSEEIIRPLHVL